jgi:hypothetical protein
MDGFKVNGNIAYKQKLVYARLQHLLSLSG